MTDSLFRAVLDYGNAHADDEGMAVTPIEGLRIMRVRAPTNIGRALYKPLLCLVLQGAKEVVAGTETHRFAAGQSLVVSVDLPVVSRIVQASRSEPYLALALELDMGVMREIMAETGDAPAAGPVSPLFIEDTGEAVRNCAERLMDLITRPEAIRVLRPVIVKEMHYWLLAGRHGAAIRRLALPDSHAERVARAVAILRAEFAEPIAVERLAAAAGMSASSFHQHFKAVTSLSPLQFQKQLRLIEARRMMLGEGLTASRAALEVGYESIPQFTREYGRMFGAPPRRDVSRDVVAGNRAAA